MRFEDQALSDSWWSNGGETGFYNFLCGHKSPEAPGYQLTDSTHLFTPCFKFLICVKHIFMFLHMLRSNVFTKFHNPAKENFHLSNISHL